MENKYLNILQDFLNNVLWKDQTEVEICLVKITAHLISTFKHGGVRVMI